MTPELSYDWLRTEVDGETGVARLTLDRPEVRNALSALLVDELTDALAWADADERVRVVVLSGEGKDFCAGADLSALSGMMESSVEEQMADADALGDLFLVIRRIGTPVVAAVHGHALAGGCGLATACDIVLASSDSRFGYPEVKIGFVPAMVMAMLRRAVGERRAYDLIVTGRIIDAADAERFGLVQHVFEADEFRERVDAFAADLAEKSASALALSKRLLYQSEGHTFEAAVRAGANVNVLARMTEDYREGVRRFLEKRGRGESGSGG